MNKPPGLKRQSIASLDTIDLNNSQRTEIITNQLKPTTADPTEDNLKWPEPRKAMRKKKNGNEIIVIKRPVI